MPNWCENEVTITFTDTTEQEQFVKQVGDVQSYISWDSTEQLFDVFIPTPPELLEGEGWWEWRIQNWGTKWNPKVNDFRVEDNLVFLRMDTAWAPPREFFVTLNEMFPSTIIELSYLEEGMAFCGKSRIQNGTEYDRYINEIPTEMYVEVGYKMDDEGNIDWENSEDTTTLWDVIEDDNRFNKYYEMEVA